MKGINSITVQFQFSSLHNRITIDIIRSSNFKFTARNTTNLCFDLIEHIADSALFWQSNIENYSLKRAP